MKILLAALLPLLFADPAAGQQVIQSGKPIPGHAANWVTNLTIGDAGPANGGPPGTGLTELNITSTLNNGSPFCINDAPTNGPFHQLCLGANASGGGLISYNAYGGAPAVPLQCDINGVFAPCAGSVGPVPFIIQGTMTGSLTTGNMPGDFGGIYTLGGISVTQDIATNTMTAAGGMPAWAVNHTFGGPGAGSGGRLGLWVDLRQIGNMPATNSQPFHTGIMSNVTAQSGTGDGAEFYGYAGQVADNIGAHYAITGGEIDVMLNQSGPRRMGWEVASVGLAGTSTTGYVGTLTDAGYTLWKGGNCGGAACIGFNVGLSFGRDDTLFPINAHGRMIGVTKGVGTAATLAADYGIDFIDPSGSPVVFTYCSFASQGICIDGNGNVTLTKTFPSVTLVMPSSYATRFTEISTSSWGLQFANDNTFTTGVYNPLTWTGNGLTLNDGTGGVYITGIPSTGPTSGKYPVCMDTAYRVYRGAVDGTC